MLNCSCPAPTSLTTIPEQDCPFNMGQIQRIAIQRAGYTFTDVEATEGEDPTPAEGIRILSTWQELMAEADNTKIVLTPMIASDPFIEAGEPITNGGGDNSTLNGVEEIEGVNPSNFTATFKGLSPEIELALKKLGCETNLVVYLFLQGGKIACVKLSSSTHKGFPIQSFFVSDRNNAGFGTKDTHAIRFSLAAGWSENMEIVTPEFNVFEL